MAPGVFLAALYTIVPRHYREHIPLFCRAPAGPSTAPKSLRRRVQ